MALSNSAFLEKIHRKVIANLKKKFDWGESLVADVVSNGKRPFPSQIMRVYEAIENGTKRILFADATGFGKTYVASMILGLLNKKKEKRHKTLLIAPQQSLETAWTFSEINESLSGLGLNNGVPMQIDQLSHSNLEGILDRNDIVCANYHTFDCASAYRYVSAILELAPRFDTILFDESQNYRSFGKRGMNLKKVIDATRKKRALLLSAIPGQNGLEDLGVPLHILDERFPFAPFDYNACPTAIKDMILAGKWFNSDRDTVKKLFGLPPLRIHDPVYCNIGDYYARKYIQVWQDGDLEIGSKIAYLRKYLTLGKIKSCEGRSDLVSLLETFPKDAAILVFNHLKTGVSSDLFEFYEWFYGKGEVAMINGDMKNVKRRVETAQRFTDGDYKVLISSFLTMGEGVPCAAGDRPLTILFKEIPYNHGQFHQTIGRGYRKGQRGPVDVYYLLSENRWARQSMQKIVESGVLEERYGVCFPSNWRDSFVDLDIYDIMLAKDELDREKVRKGIHLEEAQEATMNYNEHSLKSMRKAGQVGVLRSLGIKRKEKESPMSLFTRTGWRLVGIGEKELYRASLGEGDFKKEFGYMRDAYIDERILRSSSGDTARLLLQVVERIESPGRQLKDMLDVGCGSGVVSGIFEREMVNLDLDARMFEKWYGRGPRVKGFMSQMPFGDKSFDLVTASYSLFYGKQGGRDKEIEKHFIEVNRVLKDRGYFLATLIRTTKERDVASISSAMSRYGFCVLINDFFKGYREDGRKSNFPGVYLLVGRKEHARDTFARKRFTAYAPVRHFVPRALSIRSYRDDSVLGFDVKRKQFRNMHSQEFRNEEGVSLSDLLDGVM